MELNSSVVKYIKKKSSKIEQNKTRPKQKKNQSTFSFTGKSLVQEHLLVKTRKVYYSRQPKIGLLLLPPAGAGAGAAAATAVAELFVDVLVLAAASLLDVSISIFSNSLSI